MRVLRRILAVALGRVGMRPLRWLEPAGGKWYTGFRVRAWSETGIKRKQATTHIVRYPPRPFKLCIQLDPSITDLDHGSLNQLVIRIIVSKHCLLRESLVHFRFPPWDDGRSERRGWPERDGRFVDEEDTVGGWKGLEEGRGELVAG